MGVQERGGASRDGLGHRLGRSCLLTQLPGDAGYLGSMRGGRRQMLGRHCRPQDAPTRREDTYHLRGGLGSYFRHKERELTHTKK